MSSTGRVRTRAAGLLAEDRRHRTGRGRRRRSGRRARATPVDFRLLGHDHVGAVDRRPAKEWGEEGVYEFCGFTDLLEAIHGRCGRALRACAEPGGLFPACCAASPARMSVPQSPQDCGSAGAWATGGLGKGPGPCQARRDSALAGRERGRRAGAAHQKSSLEAISTRNHREKTNFSRAVRPWHVSHSVVLAGVTCSGPSK